MHHEDQHRSLFRRIICVCIITLTSIVSLGLIGSAYCTYISPNEIRYSVLGALTFPAWLAATVLVLIADLIWWRRTSLIAIAAILICWPQIWDFSPIHLPHWSMSEAERDSSFTIMSYNVMQFQNQDKYSTIENNRQLDYIISKSPDIACLVEARFLSPEPNTYITQEQLVAINEMYPYIYTHGSSFTIFSKYRIEPITLDFPTADFESGDMAAWRAYIKGQVVNIFVVHLRSYHLTVDNKDMFKEMTTPDKTNPKYIKEAKVELMPKLTSAAIERTEQVLMLEKYINKYGGKNVIVTGDFNDPIGSYSLHLLEEDERLKQAYAEVGFGPMVTYNANHMFYRIDHILYRGDMKPYSMSRGNLKASDHYPIMATFILKGN